MEVAKLKHCLATAEWIVEISEIGRFLRKNRAFEARTLLVRMVLRELKRGSTEQSIRRWLAEVTAIADDSPTKKDLVEQHRRSNEVELLEYYVGLILELFQIQAA